METLKNVQKETTQKINDASKRLTEKKSELESALSYAAIYEVDYNEAGNMDDRKKALHFLGKAWKLTTAILAEQETIRWNSRSAALVAKTALDNSEPNSDEEESNRKAVRYFDGIFTNTTTEQEKTKTEKKKILDRVRKLRTSSTVTVEAALEAAAN